MKKMRAQKTRPVPATIPDLPPGNPGELRGGDNVQVLFHETTNALQASGRVLQSIGESLAKLARS